MEIIQKAQAGSFESSDIIILVEPNHKKGRKIMVDSTVMLEYGEQIKKIINDKLDEFDIKNIHLIAKDKGALDLTICARLETAIKRASNKQRGTILQ